MQAEAANPMAAASPPPEHPYVKKIAELPDELYVILLKGCITADNGDIFGLCLGYY